MNSPRQLYLRTVIDLYLDQPDTPATARRADWAIAAGFYQQGTSLHRVLHAIRLGTLRRLLPTGDSDTKGPYPPIYSLAYYRTLLATLSPDDLDPVYVAYVTDLHRRLDPGAQKRGLTAKIPPP